MEKPLPTAIHIKALDFSYDDNLVLEDVSLSVPFGSFFSIIGPNGGGKTTLLKLIVGFIKPSKGKVSFPSGLKIGYVPQVAKMDLSFPISTLDLILMGCASKANWFGNFPETEKKRAKELLHLMNLKDCAIENLSGGQFQRALIARALISDPDILVLDEPTANIDAATEAKIFDILLEFKGKKTILMVSHNLNAAIKLSDSVLLVQKKVFICKPENVCDHFSLGLYHVPIKRGKDV